MGRDMLMYNYVKVKRREEGGEDNVIRLPGWVTFRRLRWSRY